MASRRRSTVVVGVTEEISELLMEQDESFYCEFPGVADVSDSDDSDDYVPPPSKQPYILRSDSDQDESLADHEAEEETREDVLEALTASKFVIGGASAAAVPTTIIFSHWTPGSYKHLSCHLNV